MSQWEMVDDGSFNGVAKHIRGLDDGSVDVKHTFLNSSSIIDANKRAQIDSMNTRMGDGLEKVASIPMTVVYEWIRDHGVNLYDPNHRQGVERLLNSSDYRYLKCRQIII
jgi:hypothetical protein